MDLPPDVILIIFCFLSTADVLSFGNCSRILNRISKDDSIWKALCIKLWHGKATMPYSYPGAKEILYSNIMLDPSLLSMLAIKKLKFLILSKDIDPRSLYFFEKREYVEKVRELYCSSVAGNGYLFTSMWKASYFYSVLESKRCIIRKEELVTLQWRVMMKQEEDHMRYVGNDDNFNARFHGGYVSFHEDDTCEALFGTTTMRYPYFLIPKNDKVIITVGPFPPLHVDRHKKCWKWILENRSVVITSEHYECD